MAGYNCLYIEENLLAFLDEELPARDREAFRQHVQQCDACHNLVEELGRLYARAGEEGKNWHPAESYYANTLHKMRHPYRQQAVRLAGRVLKPLAVAAGLALGIVLGATVAHREAPRAGMEMAAETLTPAAATDYSLWAMTEEDGQAN